MRHFRRSERGLSEIVGTLILILIVVSAATLIAAFVASYQKQLLAEESFSHDQSLESIHILGLTTAVSDGAFTSLGFTIASEYVNPSIVQGITINGEAIRYFSWYNDTTSIVGTYRLGGNLNLTPFDEVDIALCLSALCPIQGSGALSTAATIFNAPTDAGSPWTGTGIAYFLVPSGSTWESWDSIALTSLSDLTDAGTGCTGVTAATITAASSGETIVGGTTLSVPFSYSATDAGCTVPPTFTLATGGVTLSLLVPFSFLSSNEVPLPNQYLKFDIYTILQNDFTRVYLPPTPLAVVSVINPSGDNPITLLDGSMSFQPGGNGSIVNWEWSVAGGGLPAPSTSATTFTAPTDVASPWTGSGDAYFTVPSGFEWESGDSIALTAPTDLTDTGGTMCAGATTADSVTAAATGETVLATTLTVPFTYSFDDATCTAAPTGVGMPTGDAILSLGASGEEFEISPALLSGQGPYLVTLSVANSDGLAGTITISYTPPSP